MNIKNKGSRKRVYSFSEELDNGNKPTAELSTQLQDKVDASISLYDIASNKAQLFSFEDYFRLRVLQAHHYNKNLTEKLLGFGKETISKTIERAYKKTEGFLLKFKGIVSQLPAKQEPVEKDSEMNSDSVSPY